MGARARGIFRLLVISGFCVSLLAVVGLQFVPTPGHGNPAIRPEETLQNNITVPPDVNAILKRSCADCHSNETKWPWYSKVAPVSWLVGRDIVKARKVMNFSEWSIKAGKRPGSAIGILGAICADVKSGRMPLPAYLTLHSDAELSDADREAVCSWTESASQQYRLMLRKRSVLQSAR